MIVLGHVATPNHLKLCLCPCYRIDNTAISLLLPCGRVVPMPAGQKRVCNIETMAMLRRGVNGVDV